MGAVGEGLNICLDLLVLPEPDRNFRAIDGQRPFGAKIPPCQLQDPVLRLRPADQRGLARELRLPVQVDPSAGPAQTRERIVVIDCCHEFCRTLAGGLCQFRVCK